MSCSYRSSQFPEVTCQFDVPEQELMERGSVGQKWCEFHLNLSGTIGDKSDKSSWNATRVAAFHEKIEKIIDDAQNTGETANLMGVVFPGEVDFSERKFSQIELDEAIFLNDVSFSKSIFVGRASFQHTLFKGEVEFVEAKFHEAVIFGGSGFKNRVDFSRARFCDIANFDNAQFEDMTDFNETRFKGRSFFRNTEFEFLEFRMSTFLDTVTFMSATFFSSALFGGTRFKKSVDYSYKWNEIKQKNNKGTNGISFCEFEKAEFLGPVSFINRAFRGTTNFRDCIFTDAPKFHDCALHQDTDFEGAKFLKTRESDAKAYRTLKLEMENVRARREEAIFYALEQKSLRNNKNIGVLVRIFSWMYEKTADYGQSIGRPLIAAALTILVFTSIYAIFESPCLNPSCDVDWNLVSNSFEFSIQQTVRPFQVWQPQRISEGLHGGKIILKLISTLQSILMFSFFALFLLSLRWRFKRG